jgi:predicted AAA+ superfamily ATPase
MGMLWENYVISERVKFNAYNQTGSQLYFWRNYLQREIDLIEVKDNRIYAYEIKYGKESKVKIPLAFKTAYPDADFQKIDSDNYLDFIM